MDRLDSMKVFVLVVDEGSLAAAGRKLGRSPAAMSRAIAFLEERVGTELLHRTTRSIMRLRGESRPRSRESRRTRSLPFPSIPGHLVAAERCLGIFAGPH